MNRFVSVALCERRNRPVTGLAWAVFPGVESWPSEGHNPTIQGVIGGLIGGRADNA